MPLHLFDTRSRAVREFVPMGDVIGVYVCGPTVYDVPHIGNARSAVVFDLLRRLLVREHGPVRYVRNLTDIDDKIMERAAREGTTMEAVTSFATAAYHDAMSMLRVLPPDVEPRATEHIQDMVDMISRMVWQGAAYVSDGHVVFRAAGARGEGALTGQRTGRRAGARVSHDHASWKEKPEDFVLWKPSSSDQAGWDSPWGRGRPGWHIECSAMSARYLGDVCDVHAGGSDLMAPHHENEMSQSCAAHGTDEMARYWMHNAMLTVGGRKMSKSLGNFLTIEQAAAGVPDGMDAGAALRFLLLSTHYRSLLDWSPASLTRAGDMLARWWRSIEGASHDGEVPRDALSILNQDMNVPGLMPILHRLGRTGATVSDREGLAATLRLLGLEPRVLASRTASPTTISPAAAHLLALRETARKEARWGDADSIRTVLLAEHGIVLKDLPTGTEVTLRAASP